MIGVRVFQLLVVSGVLLAMLGQGMMLSFPSCLLPALLEGSSGIMLDLDTASWLASSVGLSSLAGFLASSYLMETCGRRTTFALAILPGALGWVFIYFSKDITTLMIGRVLGGTSGGATVLLGAVILGEYTSPENRGMFLNLKSAAVCVGNLAVHVLNHYIDWRNIALVALLPFVISFGLVCSWEESPSWLASMGFLEKCEDVFFALRGRNDRTYQEFDNLLKLQKTLLSPRLSKTVMIKKFLSLFTKRSFLKPLLIVVISGFLSEFSGRHVFPAYASQIIGEITGDKVQSFYYTLSIDLIITSSITFSSVLVRIMKRRVLLFSTGALSLIVLTSVCLYLHVASKNFITYESWIPLSLFVVYFVLANVCCAPFPYIIVGEIFPLSYKGAGTAVSGVFFSLLLMIALKITPYLLISLNVYGTFAIFAIIILICLVLLYIILPETKDRSLPEIESYLQTGKYDAVEDETLKKKMIDDS
ncbi:facilitated trehalose transporter Tret1-like [Plodia interpunctella]|uniref:facilitated trehalose transporter Tret1-like n=1 Tax=Plodia interpunctella TaxID=58824 RepID=UPI0023681B33|nr:facilitated trehalose transporter Tret1-like [Plodia interpunctella]